jgi:hypothetical protein
MRASPRQGRRGLRGRSASNSYPWWGARLHPLTLCLLIKMAGVKPAGAMKTPSKAFAFVILAAIMTLVVVSCVTYQFVANQKALLLIGTGTTYAEWKSQPQFDNALARVCRHGGYYDLTVVVNVGAQPIHPYKPCPSPGSIRTVKVTKSKVADRTAAGESAANDPNALHKVASADPGDIAEVANALKP